MASSSSKNWQKPRVVFQPDVHAGMLKGVKQIVGAIRPTLGPFPRIVLYDRTVGKTGRIPELLDDGGTIARRVIQIPGRDADVGAMLVRQVLWTLREEVGDGTATAAVLFQAVYEEGIRYLASGGNAMRLRVHLEQGLREALNVLESMTTGVEGKEELSKLATALVDDPELGKLMGEIFDVIGEYGRLEIRKGKRRGCEREYVEGMYWESGLLSRALITDMGRQRTEQHNAAVLITDLDIEDPRDLVPVLSTCLVEEIEELMIIARKMSDVTVGMLVMSREKGKIKVNVSAAKTPGTALSDQRVALMDMAVLTGGRPLLRGAGDTLRDVKASDLGRARRIWADRRHMGIIGGGGDPRQLREHIAHLRRLYANTSDADERASLQERIGKLMGGSATLYVGGVTETELDYNKEQASRAAEAMRGAMRDGVLPGGGAAFLAVRPMLLERMNQAVEPEERAAYRILARAFEAPIRTLLENTGYEPGEILERLASAGPGYGFDVVKGEVADMNDAGIRDITTVVLAAVRTAVKSAAMALTTDVVVHRANAPQAITT